MLKVPEKCEEPCCGQQQSGICKTQVTIKRNIKNTRKPYNTQFTVNNVLKINHNQIKRTGSIVPEEAETEGNLVWVPVNGGERYHLYAGCSDMIDPMQVSIETAINNDYTPCGRCY